MLPDSDEFHFSLYIWMQQRETQDNKQQQGIVNLHIDGIVQEGRNSSA